MTRLVVTALCLATAVLAGCLDGGRSATLTVETIVPRCDAPVDTLIVLLPGAYDHAHDFIGEGFVDAVRSRGIAADIALVDATIPYYRDGDIATRLDEDVLKPARARGIRHVWFAGISLGGLGSLIAANEERARGGPGIDGLLVIAPYLGERAIVAEVAASGGLARWKPPGTIPPDDHDRRIWQWLKTLTVERDDRRLPALYLGFGVDDRFVTAHRLLADAMPPDHVFTAPGGHDWPAWRDVWPRMLDAAPLPRGCRPLVRPAER